jgi:CBS domain-containing protein
VRLLFHFLEATVADYMTAAVKTASRELSMAELQSRFETDDFNAYPVVENDDVIGVVSKFDFLKCFAFTPLSLVPHYETLMKRTVADVMTTEFIYVSPATKLTRVLQLMIEHRLRSIPVIARDRRLAGVIAREDIMRALRDSIPQGGA